MAQVAAEAAEEPLGLGGVEMAEGAERQLQACWEALSKKGRGRGAGLLYRRYQDFMELVVQVRARRVH